MSRILQMKASPSSQSCCDDGKENVARSKRSLKKTMAFEYGFARFQKNFGAVVKKLRKEAHLSRPELARRAKFSQSTLEHIEQGRGHPTLTRMENLAAALRTRLSRLFELAQDREGQ